METQLIICGALLFLCILSLIFKDRIVTFFIWLIYDRKCIKLLKYIYSNEMDTTKFYFIVNKEGGEANTIVFDNSKYYLVIWLDDMSLSIHNILTKDCAVMANTRNISRKIIINLLSKHAEHIFVEFREHLKID